MFEVNDQQPRRAYPYSDHPLQPSSERPPGFIAALGPKHPFDLTPLRMGAHPAQAVDLDMPSFPHERSQLQFQSLHRRRIFAPHCPFGQAELTRNLFECQALDKSSLGYFPLRGRQPFDRPPNRQHNLGIGPGRFYRVFIAKQGRVQIDYLHDSASVFETEIRGCTKSAISPRGNRRFTCGNRAYLTDDAGLKRLSGIWHDYCLRELLNFGSVERLDKRGPKSQILLDVIPLIHILQLDFLASIVLCRQNLRSQYTRELQSSSKNS
jgi:hypothetical protein